MSNEVRERKRKKIFVRYRFWGREEPEVQTMLELKHNEALMTGKPARVNVIRLFYQKVLQSRRFSSILSDYAQT